MKIAFKNYMNTLIYTCIYIPNKYTHSCRIIYSIFQKELSLKKLRRQQILQQERIRHQMLRQPPYLLFFFRADCAEQHNSSCGTRHTNHEAYRTNVRRTLTILHSPQSDHSLILIIYIFLAHLKQFHSHSYSIVYWPFLKSAGLFCHFLFTQQWLYPGS